MHKADAKYLERDAEPEARALHIPGDRRFGHALVIPAYGEGENLLRTLRSVPAGPLGDVLVILVVNARADAPSEMHAANQGLLHDIHAAYPGTSVSPSPTTPPAPPMTLHEHPRGALVVIDRFREPFFLPDGQGVGLARKIGTDVAWALHLAGRIGSPWLHGTDADVKLPPDYFHQPLDLPATDPPAALIYPFHHVCADDAALGDAMRMYEVYLRYYVLSLAWAGSPYAFHTIGSTIAVEAGAYARVRGFPRRTAGEDFYFLNKLAKVGRIRTLRGAPLHIDGRESARVPFGTGRALGVIQTGASMGEDYRLYHPRVFRALACWLRVLEGGDAGGADFREAVGEAAHHDGLDPAPLCAVLDDMGAFAAVEEAAARPGGRDAFRRHIHTWFDAFRTLRFLHEMRDRFYPSLPFHDALRQTAHLPWVSVLADADLETIRRFFAAVEAERKMGSE